jgi:hypothetical protein
MGGKDSHKRRRWTNGLNGRSTKSALSGKEITPPPGAKLLGRHDAVPVLIEMLAYRDSRVRRWAGFYLHNVIYSEPKEAYPALLETWRRYKQDFRGSEKHEGWAFGNNVDAAMCIYKALLHADPEAAIQAGVFEEDPDSDPFDESERKADEKALNKSEQ